MTGKLLHLVTFVLCAGAVGCLDVRELKGAWNGQRIGEAAELNVGFPAGSSVQLQLDAVDLGSIRGRLTIDNVINDAEISPIPGAQADVLASLSHAGDPSQVHLAFAETVDGGGSAMVVVSLYDDSRIELRVLRGGAQPLYGVFRLAPGQ